MNSKLPEEYEPFEAFLLIGTNIGQRVDNLQKAKTYLTKFDIKITKASSVYESAAWGIENQNDFLNQVLKIETQMGPWELLETALSVEKKMGRQRKEKWAERIIDIDILYFDEVIIKSFDLQIPHPGIPDRKFTLEPLCEIAGDMVHPDSGFTQKELLKQCRDELWVRKFS